MVHTDKPGSWLQENTCVRPVVRAAEVGNINVKGQLMIITYCRLYRI